MKQRKSVGTVGIKGGKVSSGIAYVSIPEDQDRDKFIENVYRTQRIMMRGEVGEMWKRIFVDKIVLKEITFPETSKERGSPLVWLKIPYHNQPVVIAVIGSKGEVRIIEEENHQRFLKVGKNGVVDVDMRANLPELSFTVASNKKGVGKLRITVTNPDNTAELDLFVKGVVNLFATEKIRLISNKEISLEIVDDKLEVLALLSYNIGKGWTIKDEFDHVVELNEDGISLGSEGKSAEPAALANTLVDILDEILSGLEQAKTATSIGSQPLLNLLTFTSIKEKLDTIKSEVVTLD